MGVDEYGQKTLKTPKFQTTERLPRMLLAKIVDKHGSIPSTIFEKQSGLKAITISNLETMDHLFIEIVPTITDFF